MPRLQWKIGLIVFLTVCAAEILNIFLTDGKQKKKNCTENEFFFSDRNVTLSMLHLSYIKEII